MSELETEIAELKSEVRQLFIDDSTFDDVAVKIFHFQVKHCKPYRDFIEALRYSHHKVERIQQIPSLPIEFFKSQRVSVHQQLISGPPHAVFKSSGTTGNNTSTHFVQDRNWYYEIAKRIFIRSLGPLEDWTMIALLPGYLEQPHSSLIAMLQHFLESGLNKNSGFFLNRDQHFEKELAQLLGGSPNKKVLIWGVTHALVKWVQSNQTVWHNGQLSVLETGGMKGHGKEMIRVELHNLLKEHFRVDAIMGEYGMTELLSQAYSKADGVYQQGPTLKIRIREDRDPLFWAKTGQRGLISVIDLANIESCSFIATQDIGVLSADGTTFEVLGRADHSDQRGCNLLID